MLATNFILLVFSKLLTDSNMRIRVVAILILTSILLQGVFNIVYAQRKIQWYDTDFNTEYYGHYDLYSRLLYPWNYPNSYKEFFSTTAKKHNISRIEKKHIDTITNKVWYHDIEEFDKIGRITKQVLFTVYHDRVLFDTLWIDIDDYKYTSDKVIKYQTRLHKRFKEVKTHTYYYNNEKRLDSIVHSSDTDQYVITYTTVVFNYDSNGRVIEAYHKEGDERVSWRQQITYHRDTIDVTDCCTSEYFLGKWNSIISKYFTGFKQFPDATIVEGITTSYFLRKNNRESLSYSEHSCAYMVDENGESTEDLKLVKWDSKGHLKNYIEFRHVHGTTNELSVSANNNNTLAINATGEKIGVVKVVRKNGLNHRLYQDNSLVIFCNYTFK